MKKTTTTGKPNQTVKTKLKRSKKKMRKKVKILDDFSFFIKIHNFSVGLFPCLSFSPRVSPFHLTKRNVQWAISLHVCTRRLIHKQAKQTSNRRTQRPAEVNSWQLFMFMLKFTSMLFFRIVHSVVGFRRTKKPAKATDTRQDSANCAAHAANNKA